MRWLALLAGILLIAGCGEGPVVGQFGAYPKAPMQLRLADGEVLPVYRVKYWEFDDGSPPALQLEYEPPFSIQDSVAVRDLADRIWPAFAPYVERAGVSTGILTATNLRRQRRGLGWTATLHHRGMIADRDTTGQWFFLRETEPLPLSESGSVARIFTADGQPPTHTFETGARSKE